MFLCFTHTHTRMSSVVCPLFFIHLTLLLHTAVPGSGDTQVHASAIGVFQEEKRPVRCESRAAADTGRQRADG